MVYICLLYDRNKLWPTNVFPFLLCTWISLFPCGEHGLAALVTAQQPSSWVLLLGLYRSRESGMLREEWKGWVLKERTVHLLHSSSSSSQKGVMPCRQGASILQGASSSSSGWRNSRNEALRVCQASLVPIRNAVIQTNGAEPPPLLHSYWQ